MVVKVVSWTLRNCRLRPPSCFLLCPPRASRPLTLWPSTLVPAVGRHRPSPWRWGRANLSERIKTRNGEATHATARIHHPSGGRGSGVAAGGEGSAGGDLVGYLGAGTPEASANSVAAYFAKA